MRGWFLSGAIPWIQMSDRGFIVGEIEGFRPEKIGPPRAPGRGRPPAGRVRLGRGNEAFGWLEKAWGGRLLCEGDAQDFRRGNSAEIFFFSV
jgi:hypothetical protein